MPADYDLDKGYKFSYLALLAFLDNFAWEPHLEESRNLF